ncbi:MAG: hypothetical protein ABF587_01305 [Leuconostoc sp.]|uniref:hypothetical protein n=1 Tax=Leuconostoc sp. TaxID=1930076 RepID=UPI0039EC4739
MIELNPVKIAAHGKIVEVTEICLRDILDMMRRVLLITGKFQSADPTGNGFIA